MLSLLELNVMAALLIILILIIRAAFYKRLPPRLFTSLWLIAAIRLIIPLGIPVALDFVPAASTVSYIDRLNGRSLGAYTDAYSGVTYYSNNVSPADAKVFTDIRGVIVIISVCALIIGLALIIIKHIMTRRRLSDALPCADDSLRAFVNGFGFKREVRLLISDRIASPITFGLIKPVIILPRSAQNVDMTAAIAHEAAHIKHFDIAYKLFIMSVTLFYWYDPFVWIMFLCASRDVERACDSFALSYCGCDRKAYSDMLIGMTEKRIDILSGSFGAGEIKLRLKHIMTSGKTGSAAAFISVLLAACSLSVFVSAQTGRRSDYGIYTPVYMNVNGNLPVFYIPPQRYYLEGGTKDEYIEFFDDNTVQIYGFDYYSEQLEYYRELYPDYTEEERIARLTENGDPEHIEYLEAESAFWRARHGYIMGALPSVIFINEAGERLSTGISYSDENTMYINKHIYKAEKPWHAGVYMASDAVCPTPAEYICDDGSVLTVKNDGISLTDKDGNITESGEFAPVFVESSPEFTLIATDTAALARGESSPGYWFDPEKGTLTHSVSGKVYTVKSYPLLSQ